jgi:hypothetical protein
MLSPKKTTARIKRKKILKLYSGLTRDASPDDNDSTYRTNAAEYTTELIMVYSKNSQLAGSGTNSKNGKRKIVAIEKNRNEAETELASVPNFLTIILSYPSRIILPDNAIYGKIVSVLFP